MIPTLLLCRTVMFEDLLDIWSYDEINAVALECGSEDFLIFSSRSID